MVSRTWRNLLLTALGMGVLAGAGQLGIAFALGIVQLTGASAGATVNQWPAQLVWVGWFAAHAAVAGTVVTARLARRHGLLESTGRLVAIAAAAALGATVVAPLCVRPAQAAERFSVDPIWAVGICAILGALVGGGAAIAVLVRPPLGWNLAAVGTAVWLAALVSAVPSLSTEGPLPAVRLGVLESTVLDTGAVGRQAVLILPAVALLIGVVTGGLARWRGHSPLVNGVTGAAGMMLVAFAYLTAGPGDAVDRYQITPYYGALLAVAAGALGSGVAASVRWPFARRTTEAPADEPTDVHGPLSADPAVPHPMAPAAAGTADEPEPLAGARPVGAIAARFPIAAEPLGYAAPVGDRDTGVVAAGSATRTAVPATIATPAPLAELCAPGDLTAAAEVDHIREGSEPEPATVAHLPVVPGGDGFGSAGAEAGNTEPDETPADGTLAAPGTRRMYQPPKSDPVRVQATRQVVPARRVPSSTEPAADTTATQQAGPPEGPEPALPPRHRPPLPSLDRAATWDALATARRAGPPSATDAAAAAAAAAPASAVEAGRVNGRLGLFRRNRSRADADGAATREDGGPLPRQDAEFVDWVNQLGKPVSDTGPAQDGGGKSIRSTGRRLNG
ncbi:hypothetical protein [Micromonospora sp. NPDC005367]|uniref:hypothetical protein n=1 Tax=Micromonospora sp. NPDC005367 TaxID=3155590 RepID=UPI00339F0F2A